MSFGGLGVGGARGGAITTALIARAQQATGMTDAQMRAAVGQAASLEEGLRAIRLMRALSLVLPKGFVFDGDSITEQPGGPTNSKWVDQFVTNTGATASNVALSGRALETIATTTYAQNAAPLFDATTRDTYVVWAGTNDFGNNSRTSAQVRGYMQVLAPKVKATGFRLFAGTVAKRGDSNWDATKEGHRTNYNAWLRANWRSIGIDGLIDFEAIAALQDPTNTYFFNGDRLHLVVGGSRRVAETVRGFFGLPIIQDSVPSSWSWTAVADAEKSTVYVSTEPAIVGLTTPAVITITGGEYRINGGAWTDQPGLVENWDKVQVRRATGTADATAYTASVTIGGVVRNFVITTAAAAAPALPSFNTTPVVGTATFGNSNRSVSGLSAPSNVTIARALAGKMVFAVKVDALGSTTAHALIGISDGAASANGPGFDNHSFAAVSNGGMFSNGGSVGGAMSAWTAGTVVAWAVDMTNRRAWATTDGANWSGAGNVTYSLAQVSAGTGGYDISARLPGTVYPCVGAISNAGKAFSIVDYPYALPTDYTKA